MDKPLNEAEIINAAWADYAASLQPDGPSCEACGENDISRLRVPTLMAYGRKPVICGECFSTWWECNARTPDEILEARRQGGTWPRPDA